MVTYPIHITAEITGDQLHQGLFIYLFRATRMPPHLGVIFNGKLYDITLNGPSLGLDVDEFLATITKKYTKAIFIELKTPKNSLVIEDLILEKVLKYERVTDQVSCLSPIKDFVSEAYGINVSSASFVFDLLPILDFAEIKKNSYHLNCSRNIVDGIFQLTTYTQEDIDRCMKALNRKEVIC